ncbi:CoA transferase [Streptomyces sp. NPDC006798]|uniref:CaiB/BaiF CoA-transferase family protein n=1 Tax=Streptomyces sp. NPDC006798 TaxID=3155462 RepID=UPI003404B915
MHMAATAPSETTAPHEGSPLTHRAAPLAGFTAAYPERLPAGDVLLRHLAALGAEVVRDDDRTDQALRLTARTASGPVLDCRIDWSDPGADGVLDETTVQAAAGLMAVHGRRTGVPTRIPVDYASACSGVIAAQGVLAALVARERGTGITSVGTTVTHAGLLAISQYLAAASADDDEIVPKDAPENGPPFRSRDGILFEIEALDQRPWQAFWAELGVPVQDVRRAYQPFVMRYPKAVSPLPATLAPAVAEHDFAALTAIAERTGMSVCRIRTVDERREDGDALVDGKVPGPWRFTPSGDPAPEAPGAVPPTADQPLRGITVVEAGRRIQAPMATLVLALLGARVVRIEPLDGDPLRGMPPMVGDCSARFIALNRGKEVLWADLKSAEGRASVVELVREADVFLHNWAPGKAAVFGLDSDQLLKVNPRLVYGYSSGWGDALGDNPPLGTDFMAQAYSGLAEQMAVDGAPRPSLMTLIDVLGGLVAAEGLIAGLLWRERNGRGLRVDTSLLSASTVLQYDVLERPRNRHAPGCGNTAAPVLDGPWATADGWLALSARSHTAVGRLCRTLGLDTALTEERLRTEVARALGARPTAEWLAELDAAGVPATAVATDLTALPDAPAARRALTRQECTLVTAPWRFDA